MDIEANKIKRQWKMPWDANKIANLLDAEKRKKRGQINIILSNVYVDTIARIKSGELDNVMAYSPNGFPRFILGKRTDFYDYEQKPVDEIMGKSPNYNTIVSIEITDSLEAGKNLIEEGFSPVVLAMANRRDEALIEAEYGAYGQEKDILRRSDLTMHIASFSNRAENYDVIKSSHNYPLDRNFGGIYSSSVIVFRGREENGFPLLDNPYMIDIVSVAAMFAPKTDSKGKILSEMILGIKNKIRTIYRAALHHGKDAMVLGAFGCGSLRNPPLHIAQIFREVLEEHEFKGRFKKIVFAMRKHDEYQIFKSVFNSFLRNLK